MTWNWADVWLWDVLAKGWECIILSPSTKCSCEKSVTLLQYHAKMANSSVLITVMLRLPILISVAKVEK